MASIIQFDQCPRAIQMTYNNLVYFVSEVAPQTDLSYDYEIYIYNDNNYFIKRIGRKDEKSNLDFFFVVLNNKKNLSLKGICEIFDIVSSQTKTSNIAVRVYTALLNTDGTVLYYEVNES